ncbi:unnamed protein product [Brassica oleracea]
MATNNGDVLMLEAAPEATKPWASAANAEALGYEALGKRFITKPRRLSKDNKEEYLEKAGTDLEAVREQHFARLMKELQGTDFWKLRRAYSPGSKIGVWRNEKGKRLISRFSDREMKKITRLLQLFLAYEEDPNVKLLILKGQGKAFCAGGDVRPVICDIVQAFGSSISAAATDDACVSFLSSETAGVMDSSLFQFNMIAHHRPFDAPFLSPER